MPIYDYKCKDCDIVFDVYHKGKEIIEDILCPKCGSTNYKKLISAPSLMTNSNSFDLCSSSSSGSCGPCSSGNCSSCGSH